MPISRLRSICIHNLRPISRTLMFSQTPSADCYQKYLTSQQDEVQSISTRELPVLQFNVLFWSLWTPNQFSNAPRFFGRFAFKDRRIAARGKENVLAQVLRENCLATLRLQIVNTFTWVTPSLLNTIIIAKDTADESPLKRGSSLKPTLSRWRVRRSAVSMLIGKASSWMSIRW